MAQQTIGLGSAPNDGTGDPIRTAFDKCNDNFDELYDESFKLKGSTDCSTNPNYPAALKGDAYRVSVAGKIGGASGIDVEVGDLYYALADNAGGTQASVGTSWDVLQGNVTGSGGTIDVEDEGTPVISASTLNFTGAGVVATDAGGGVVDVTIAGGGGGVDVEEEGGAVATATTLNFIGSSVTATDAGSGQVDVTITGGGDLGALHVQDQQAATTAGGTFTSGAWQTRVLNTSVSNTITSASLSSNQITLPAGTYDITASAPAHAVNNHQLRLENITDTATPLISGTAYARSTGGATSNTRALLMGRFTIAGTKVFELQHRCETTMATTGFGVGAGNSWGAVVFADVMIKRVA